MCEHDAKVSRRRALGSLCALGAAGVLGHRWLGGNGRPFDGAIAAAFAASEGACMLAPELTIGPYFVDEHLNRSDITEGSSSIFIADAVPLALTIHALSPAAGCVPLAGVQIDVWHCHAGGLYSDEAANGTLGQTWLRGYQVTDANGSVSFATVYPGWYPGRTIHIHLMARWFDSGGNTTYAFTTQLYFDEAANNAVMALAPYDSRGHRDTTNSGDTIFSPSMLVDTQRNGDGSYRGAISIGLDLQPAIDPVFANGFETA
jgi:protocatechuate 3,4-dioxygenase beta subunit